jgi:hypothetical protein
MFKESRSMTREEILELVHMEVKTREIGKVASSEVVVVHETILQSVFFLRHPRSSSITRNLPN